MPTSTPEERQKLCHYCQTPADPLAVNCTNCGSALPKALPIALPRPIERVVEAQARWSIGKTGAVTSIASFLLGLMINYELMGGVAVTVLAAFWFIFIMPVMLAVSSFLHAENDAGRIVVNLLLAIGLWFAGPILTLIGATL